MRTFITLVATCAFCSVAHGYSMTVTSQVDFTSSKQAPKLASVAAFDTNLGTLQQVDVAFVYGGSVTAMADNDDPFNTGQATAEMIRAWSATGPGVTTPVVSKTMGPITHSVGVDNGDGTGLIDATAPDGYDFSPDLAFANVQTSTYNPASLTPYQHAGPGGTVDFTIKPEQMANILKWTDDSTTPDVWQLQVKDPKMDVTVKVTYYYAPEPASLGLLGLGLLAILRRRA